MGLKDQNPNALSYNQKIEYAVAWIQQLRGQVWGLIQNGGGGGGGTQDLQSVLSYGNSAFNQSIILEGNDYSQITISGAPDSSYVEVISPDSTNGLFLFVNDTYNYIQFVNDGNRLQLQAEGPVTSDKTVEIPIRSGTILLDDLLEQPNGIATLDGTGLVPVTQLPFSAIAYKGAWNAFTNSPTLTDGIGTAGDFYFVSVAGTQDLGSGNITFGVGDMVVYNGSVWQKVGTPIPTTQVVELQTDVAYQLVLTDNQKLLKFPFTIGRNITVPLNATVPFPVGNRVDIMMMGDGQATFVGETDGVTTVSIRSKGGNTKTNGKYTVVSIEKIATDEWVLVGDLTS
jgi:hypothetical protein